MPYHNDHASSTAVINHRYTFVHQDYYQKQASRRSNERHYGAYKRSINKKWRWLEFDVDDAPLPAEEAVENSRLIIAAKHSRSRTNAGIGNAPTWRRRMSGGFQHGSSTGLFIFCCTNNESELKMLVINIASILCSGS